MDYGENCIINYELYSPYYLPNIVSVIKSRKMRWAGLVACKGKGEVFTGFWLGDPKGIKYWEDLGVGESIIFRWTSRRQGSM
jgi:hypothetical protein